jgi:hypothetical protein
VLRGQGGDGCDLLLRSYYSRFLPFYFRSQDRRDRLLSVWVPWGEGARTRLQLITLEDPIETRESSRHRSLHALIPFLLLGDGNLLLYLFLMLNDLQVLLFPIYPLPPLLLECLHDLLVSLDLFPCFQKLSLSDLIGFSVFLISLLKLSLMLHSHFLYFSFAFLQFLPVN